MQKTIVFRKKEDFKKGYITSPLLFLKKSTNFALSELQLRLHSTRLLASPLFLNVDPNSTCQLHCPLCPNGRGYDGRFRGKMSFKDFKVLMDEIGDFLLWIDFTKWGEPLFNDEIYEMIAYARKKLIYTSTSSNLNQLKSPERLVSSGLDELSVSLDGATQETYEKYRKGGNLNNVLENLRRLIAERQRQKKRTPYIIWQYLVLKHNTDEIQMAEKLAREVGCDRIDIIGAHSLMGFMPFSSVPALVSDCNEYLLPRNSEFSVYNEQDELKKPASQCTWLWRRAMINSNGSVSPCCGIWPDEYDFGNCFTSGFNNIWNNSKYQQARRAVKIAIQGKSLDRTDTKVVCQLCAEKRNYIEGLDASRLPFIKVKT